MNVAQLSGFILICLMISLVYLTTKFVSSVRFRGHGIYFITINAWFRGHKVFKDWLKDNYGYLWCIILIVSLSVTILLLIEPFRHNKMFIRPEASIFVNIFLWVSILYRDKWLYGKVK